jgi:CBS domain-containing protein
MNLLIFVCLKANELMSKPITIPRDSKISDAIKKLIDYKISHLVTQERGKPIGVVSEKDLGLFLYRDSSKAGLDEIPLEGAVTKIIFSKGTTPIKECAKEMIEKKIGALVIGNEQSLEGIITKTDIVRYFAKWFKGTTTVGQIESARNIWVSTEDPLSEVIETMFKNRITRVFVKNQKHEPVGIISFRDLLGISLQLGSEEEVTESSALSGKTRVGFLIDSGFGGATIARDVMTPSIISVNASDSLAHACKVMLDNNVSGLAVINKDGTRSVISSSDIVWFLALS